MKRIFLLCLLALSFFYIRGQTISLETPFSAMTWYIGLEVTMVGTIGESFTETLTHGDYNLTQGFHQPDESSMNVNELLSSLDLSYYPNPITDRLFIELSYDLPETSFQVQITDVFGRLYKACNLERGSNEINCSDIPDGLLVMLLCKNNIRLKSYKLQKISHN